MALITIEKSEFRLTCFPEKVEIVERGKLTASSELRPIVLSYPELACIEKNGDEVQARIDSIRTEIRMGNKKIRASIWGLAEAISDIKRRLNQPRKRPQFTISEKRSIFFFLEVGATDAGTMRSLFNVRILPHARTRNGDYIPTSGKGLDLISKIMFVSVIRLFKLADEIREELASVARIHAHPPKERCGACRFALGKLRSVALFSSTDTPLHASKIALSLEKQLRELMGKGVSTVKVVPDKWQTKRQQRKYVRQMYDETRGRQPTSSGAVKRRRSASSEGQSPSAKRRREEKKEDSEVSASVSSSVSLFFVCLFNLFNLN